MSFSSPVTAINSPDASPTYCPSFMQLDMPAFFGNHNIHALYLERVRRHVEEGCLNTQEAWREDRGDEFRFVNPTAEELPKLHKLRKWHGNVIAMLLHEYKPALFPEKLNLPLWLAGIVETVCANLPQKEAEKFAVEWLEAVPVGRDLRNAIHLIALDRLALCREAIQKETEKNGESSAVKSALPIIRRVMAYHGIRAVKECMTLDSAKTALEKEIGDELLKYNDRSPFVWSSRNWDHRYTTMSFNTFLYEVLLMCKFGLTPNNQGYQKGIYRVSNFFVEGHLAGEWSARKEAEILLGVLRDWGRQKHVGMNTATTERTKLVTGLYRILNKVDEPKTEPLPNPFLVGICD